MPRQVLFVQGAGEGAHDHWDNRLIASLSRELGAGYAVRYPRMPDESEPKYTTWKTALLQEFQRLEDGVILVGHSVGGTVLLHTLADGTPGLRPGALILIAPPFIGDGGWQSDDVPARPDFSTSLPAELPVRLYHGNSDRDVPFAHAGLYAHAIPQAVVCPLPKCDHQLNNDLSIVARDIRALTL